MASEIPGLEYKGGGRLGELTRWYHSCPLAPHPGADVCAPSLPEMATFVLGGGAPGCEFTTERVEQESLACPLA